MNMHKVILVEGDGIGPEVCTAMCKIVAASGAQIEWQKEYAGVGALEMFGDPLPARTVDAIRECGCAIKGPTATPVGGGFRSVNVGLRQGLNLYANVRPIISIPGAGGRYSDVNLVMVRENTEDLYAGIEFPEGAPETLGLIRFIRDCGAGSIKEDSGISIKPISHSGTKRIVEFAFDYAKRDSRRSVCAVHKANIMKLTDGLFLHDARSVAEEHPDIAFQDQIVDAFCMNLVLDPSKFDVVVLPNLYGDIASDVAAGLVGGLGLVPGANIGDDCAVYEAAHGSAPDIAGKGLANPTAIILSAAMMLDGLGEPEAADRIRNAVIGAYAKGECLTGDIAHAGDAASTSEFADAIIGEMR